MNKIEFGDCIETMRRWPAGIAQMCVTSPPYFGLRDYGHEGQIGLEETPEQFIAKLVDVFREVRRVLADDGVLFVNIGDSYCNTEKWGGGGGNTGKQTVAEDGTVPAWAVRQKRAQMEGIKPKDLIGIPWMLAFALRADGWYLRQEIIWAKPNPMPESVTDRCTKAHEQIFLLSKSPRYFVDAEGMKEPATGQLPGNVNPVRGVKEDPEKHRTRSGLHAYAERQRAARDSFKRDGSKREQAIPGQSMGTHRPDREESEWDTASRNRRSVWSISTKPYKGAHFATFPPELPERCILMGSRPGDVILDPFMGSGTTAQVALWLGRQYIGCELNPAYEPLQQERIHTPREPEPEPAFVHPAQLSLLESA